MFTFVHFMGTVILKGRFPLLSQIGLQAFQSAGNADSKVELLDGLPKLSVIDRYAFYGFKGPVIVTGSFPLLSQIGYSTFSSASNADSKVELLGELVPKLSAIGTQAFLGYKGTVIVKGTFLLLSQIESFAFHNAGNADSKVELLGELLPKLSAIASNAFAGFKGMVIFTGSFPTLSQIGQQAFQSAGNAGSKVELVGLPKLTRIDDYTFDSNKATVIITGPFPMLSWIGTGAFRYGTSTSNVVIACSSPSGLTVGAAAFQEFEGTHDPTGEQCSCDEKRCTSTTATTTTTTATATSTTATTTTSATITSTTYTSTSATTTTTTTATQQTKATNAASIAVPLLLVLFASIVGVLWWIRRSRAKNDAVEMAMNELGLDGPVIGMMDNPMNNPPVNVATQTAFPVQQTTSSTNDITAADDNGQLLEPTVYAIPMQSGVGVLHLPASSDYASYDAVTAKPASPLRQQQGGQMYASGFPAPEVEPGDMYALRVAPVGTGGAAAGGAAGALYNTAETYDATSSVLYATASEQAGSLQAGNVLYATAAQRVGGDGGNDAAYSLAAAAQGGNVLYATAAQRVGGDGGNDAAYSLAAQGGNEIAYALAAQDGGNDTYVVLAAGGTSQDQLDSGHSQAAVYDIGSNSQHVQGQADYEVAAAGGQATYDEAAAGSIAAGDQQPDTNSTVYAMASDGGVPVYDAAMAGAGGAAGDVMTIVSVYGDANSDSSDADGAAAAGTAAGAGVGLMVSEDPSSTILYSLAAGGPAALEDTSSTVAAGENDGYARPIDVFAVPNSTL